jgi:hypothetical protein
MTITMIPTETECTLFIAATLALLSFSHYYSQDKASWKKIPPSSMMQETITKLAFDEEIDELMQDFIVNVQALRQLLPGVVEYSIRAKHISELCLELRALFTQSLRGMPHSSTLAPLRFLSIVDADIVSTFEMYYTYKQALSMKTRKGSIDGKVLAKSIVGLQHALLRLFNERVRTHETEGRQHCSMIGNTVHSGSQGNTGGFVIQSPPVGGSVFGSHQEYVSQADITGTSQVPFNRVTKTDGDEVIILNSITAVTDYESTAKSFEELRWEDYKQGNFGSGTVSNSLLGSTPHAPNISALTPAKLQSSTSAPTNGDMPPSPPVGVQSPPFGSPLGEAPAPVDTFPSESNGAAPPSLFDDSAGFYPTT